MKLIFPILISLVVINNLFEKKDRKKFYKDTILNTYITFCFLFLFGKLINYFPILKDYNIIIGISLLYLLMKVLKKEKLYFEMLIFNLFFIQRSLDLNFINLLFELFLASTVYILLKVSFDAVILRIDSERENKYFDKNFIKILIIFMIYIIGTSLKIL